MNWASVFSIEGGVSDANYESEENGAQILKCGVNRVWVDPRYVDQISGAVQKSMYAN